MQNIPSVDLRDFLSDEPTRKQKFVNEIGKAFEDIGFVALKGHFLNDALVTELYGEIRNFFALPLDTKYGYEIPGIGGQRGYVSFGKEHAKGKKEGDLKSFGILVNMLTKIQNMQPNILIMLRLKNCLDLML